MTIQEYTRLQALFSKKLENCKYKGNKLQVYEEAINSCKSILHREFSQLNRV